jgi:hypothetical protein
LFVPGLIEGAVFEHGVEDVDAVAGEANDRVVMALIFCALPVVVGPRFGAVQ